MKKIILNLEIQFFINSSSGVLKQINASGANSLFHNIPYMYVKEGMMI